MLAKSNQFITDEQGKKIAVIIPLKSYQKMLEDLEELDDIRLYDEAKKTKGKAIPAAEAFKQLDAKRKKA